MPEPTPMPVTLVDFGPAVMAAIETAKQAASLALVAAVVAAVVATFALFMIAAAVSTRS